MQNITKDLLRFAIVSVVCLIMTTSLASKDDSNTALKRILNSKGYVLTSPAESWPYPGGFLVANNNSATFIDLPSNVARPNVQPANADFPAVTQTKKFSLSAVLTGMLAVIGGNPGGGFGHSSNTTFTELKSLGTRITYQQAQSILDDKNVQATIKNWLNTAGQRVYILGVVLTTEKISVTTNSSTNLDLAFNGSAVSKCSDTTPGKSTNSAQNPSDAATSQNDATKTSAAKAKTPNSTSTTPTAPAAAKPQSSPSPASASSPGGELHLCVNSSNALTMNTDSPLVFAAGTYRITLLPGGTLNLEPIMQTTPGGEMEQGGEVKPKPSSAAAVTSTWVRRPWPGTGAQ